MSSAIYISPKKPIKRAEWEAFCTRHGITHSPQTIGGNVYYKDRVEISFDVEGTIVTEHPPESDFIVVSSYWMQNLDDVVRVARWIIKEWKCEMEYDLEFRWDFKQSEYY